MDHTLTPFGLFWQAGPVVKCVIVLLLLASVWCWIIVAECLYGTWRLRSGLRRARRAQTSPIVARLREVGVHAAADHIADEDAYARRERVLGAQRRRIQELIETAQGGLVNLAVISSVAPFIGLFGTVWGIMSSFIGIADAKDTSLAVVAPGIAEALAATAVGLAAAIPAAFAYNRFAAAFAKIGKSYNRLVEDEAVDLLRRAPGGVRSGE